MTATTEPRGGLDLGWDPGEDGWGPAMNANLLRLSRLGFHPSVLSATTTAPPGSPISGSGYIIPSGATGAWAGKTGQVAVWDGVAWAYAAPRDGWTMHVDGAGLTTYDGGSWSQANVATAAGVGALASSLKGAANGVAELGADGKVPSAQLPAAYSPIVSVAKTMEFTLANETTTNPVQILTVPVPVGFFTTNGLIELDLDLDFLYVASGNRITLSFEVGVSMMWLEWNDDIPADTPRVFHGYIGKYKVESGETYVRMAGTLNGVRISGEYHDVTSTVAGQTSFSVSGHVGIEGVGAHVNCAVAKVFA